LIGSGRRERRRCTAGPDVLDRARDIALEAVALAPDEARCHRILGLILLYCREFDASERHYARALEINPYDADTLMQKGHLLAMRGKPEAGLLLADRAVRLNSLHPVWCHYDRAEILLAGERYGEAIAALSCLPRKDAWHSGGMAGGKREPIGVDAVSESIARRRPRHRL